jgi:hypothetical protein
MASKNLLAAEKIDLMSVESRMSLAKMTTKLFHLWELNTADQLALLGLSPKSLAVLTRYASGGTLPKSRDMLDRVGLLLSIHRELRILFPYNRDLCYSWIKHRNTAFNNLIPLDIMREQGIVGITRISAHLRNYIGQ